MKTNNKKSAIFFIVITLSIITTMALTSIIYLSSATTVFAVHAGEGSQQKFSAKLSGD